MSVESFDPSAQAAVLSAPVLTRLLGAAAAQPPEFGLSQLEREQFAGLSQVAAGDWRAAVADLSAAELVALVEFFTQAAEAIPGWEAGAKSPVIPLVAELKSRGEYPSDLTSWIRAHSTNRFLPYGSLADRL